MAQQNPLCDLLRKESIRIILERFQDDMISKMNHFPAEQPVSENVEEQLDNAYVNRKGVPLAMDIFKPKVDAETELPVIVVIHGAAL
jgi:acetyl esterase/lipase